MKSISKIVAKVGLGVALGILIALIIYVIGHRNYNGIWEMEGYGLTFKINNGLVKTYEVTDSYYCEESGFNGFVFGKTLYSGLGKLHIKKDGSKLELEDIGAQVAYRLTKKDNKYFTAKKKVQEKAQSEKFDMFYEMYHENYAFEALYKENLADRYLKIKASVNDSMSDQELFGAMKQLVSGLKDGHISIEWNDNVYCPTDYIPEWISNKEQQNVLTNLIVNKYAKEYKKFKDCPIRYGKLSEKIGYIVIHGMGVEALNKAGTTKKAMDQIISEFNKKGIEKVVIELRFNGGGFDEASLCLAGYFTEKPYLAYKKQAYVKGKYTALQEIRVKPNEIHFNGKVVVLTSGYTISAAETFLRAMLANPENKITVIGEKTAGFYSDAFDRSLPGGICYSLSNERYLWYNGEGLEGKGVVPDPIIPVSIENAKKGVDDALEWVLQN